MNRFQSKSENKILDGSYTRANLLADHIDMTVPAKRFIYVNSEALMCTSSRCRLNIYHKGLLTYLIFQIVGGANKHEF